MMELEITPKGALYAADCSRCGATIYSHEFAHPDHNERRDAMEHGRLICEYCCVGYADKETFVRVRGFKQYAGRYTAPGYLDCTDWHFDANKRRLVQELREMYGDEA